MCMKPRSQFHIQSTKTPCAFEKNVSKCTWPSEARYATSRGEPFSVNGMSSVQPGDHRYEKTSDGFPASGDVASHALKAAGGGRSSRASSTHAPSGSVSPLDASDIASVAASLQSPVESSRGASRCPSVAG